MDNLFAIILGLCLRVVVDTASPYNLRLGGTLVGIWEGIVLHHFSHKRPASFDPYITCGIRFFIDLYITGNVSRIAITLLWTWLSVAVSETVGQSHLPARRDSRTLVPPAAFFRVQIHEAPSRRVSHRRPPTIQNPPLSSRYVQSRVAVPSIVIHQTPDTPNLDCSVNLVTSTVSGLKAPHFFPTPPETPASDCSHAPDTLFQNDRGAPQVFSTKQIPPQSISSDGVLTRSGTSGPETSNRKQVQREVVLVRSQVDVFDNILFSGEFPRTGLDAICDEELDQDRTPTIHAVGLPPVHHPPEHTIVDIRKIRQVPVSFVHAHLTQGMATTEQTENEVEVNITSVARATSEDSIGFTPSQDEPLHEVESPPETFQTLEDAESVISTLNQLSLMQTAEILRKEAVSEGQKMDRLKRERSRALTRRKSKEAFLLGLEAREAGEKAEELHRKAERRYFRAHNLYPRKSTIDLHGLRVPEAIRRTESAIRDIVLDGRTELSVIVGRGNHSLGGKAVLRPAVQKALTQAGIPATLDGRNQGLIRIVLPYHTR